MPDRMRRRASGNRQSGQAPGTQHNVHVHTGTGGERGERPAKVSTDEIDSFTMRLIGRYGSAEAALTHIAGEQLKYRRRAQHAETRADDLEGQIPTSEDVVLKGDEAKEYKALKTANDKFTLVGMTTQIKELGDLRSKTAKDTRTAELKTAAGSKYKLSLLSKVLGDTPLSFKAKLAAKKDNPEETEEIQVPFVKVGDTLISLDDWLKQEHEDLMEVIVAKEGEETSGNTGTTQQTTGGPGPIMPKQTPSGGAQGGTKKGEQQLLAAVDKTLSTHMSPGMRRKEASGQK